MKPAALAQAAQQLLAARRDRQPLAAVPFAALDRAGAYAIQRRVEAQLGRPAGWKIGRDAAGEPVYAGLSAPLCQRSPARLRRADFFHCQLECELAVVFERALPPRAEPYTRDEVGAALRSLHAAVEIVDTRFRDWPAVAPHWLLADGLSHGAFVLGGGVAATGLDALNRGAYSLHIDGQLLARGAGAHPAGDPAAALVWLANALSAAGPGIRAGDIVTTGTFNTPVAVRAGQRALLYFEAVGTVALDID